MIRARSARLRRVVAARTHAVSCARSCAATANLVVTAMPCLHHAITGMASELTRRDTRAVPQRPSRPNTTRAAAGSSHVETVAGLGGAGAGAQARAIGGRYFVREVARHAHVAPVPFRPTRWML